MYIAFGIIWTVIAIIAGYAAGYMGSHDYNGTGITQPGQVSSNAIICFLIALLCGAGAIIFFSQA